MNFTSLQALLLQGFMFHMKKHQEHTLRALGTFSVHLIQQVLHNKLTHADCFPPLSK